MAVMRVEQVRLAGVAAAVPDQIRTVDDDAARFGTEDALKISQSVGVHSRRFAPGHVCASDLCFTAADDLINRLSWPRESIQALIFVTQTPDYVAPATACTLQSRLGLGTACAAFDINLGCSGYVYGLATAAQFCRSLSTGTNGTGRVLLLAGDTITRLISPDDRALVPLFGDAGSATALEFDADSEPMVFTLGTDGRGRDHLLVPAGGFRTPSNTATAERTHRDDGNTRADDDFYMNGAEVFLFTLREVPGLFKQTLAAASWDLDQVDAVVMHQANEFILNHLRRRLKIPAERFVVSLDGFGNTSAASIPLAMCHSLRNDEFTRLNVRDESGPEISSTSDRRLLLGGFGVGWSWGGAAVACRDTVFANVLTHHSDSACFTNENTASVDDVTSPAAAALPRREAA